MALHLSIRSPRSSANRKGDRFPHSQFRQQPLDEHPYLLTIPCITLIFKVHCSAGQLYNILKGTCDEFTCSFGYKAKDNYCIKDNSTEPTSILRPEDYRWYRDANQVESYITHVCISISVLGGVLIIVTHTLFKELRNRGGLLLIGLSSAILFTDILFFVCEQNTKVIAIILHWGLLVINFWTIIIAVDLCTIFLRKGLRTTSLKDALYLSLAAYVAPLLIVILCVILDETKTIHFGYGENNVCWMSAYYPRIISYTILSLLVSLSCLVCLLVLLMHLKRQNQERKSKLKSSYRVNLIRLALKLVFLLGIIELVGFIQIPHSTLTENELKFNVSFSFIYGALRSLRNTFIFLFVLMDRKTLNLYRKRLSKLKNTNKEHSISQPVTLNSSLSTTDSKC